VLSFALLAAGAASAQTIEGKVVAVSDGDSLTFVGKGVGKRRVRLAGIDAPEREQAFGAAARRSLAEICLRKAATVEIVDVDRYNRTVAKVKCGEADASAEQVRHGMAWVVARNIMPTSPLYEMEANARLRRIGLWSGEKPEPPWQWRARHPAATKK
jgi:endonuclease YncB( thermonuclease family)